MTPKRIYFTWKGLRYCSLLLMGCLMGLANTFAQQNPASGTQKDTLPFPIHDRYSDFLSNKRSPFDLSLPPNIRDSIVYDPATKTYQVYEKIGDAYYRTPTYYTQDEFLRLMGRQQEIQYFQKRNNTLSLLNRGQIKPKLNVGDRLFNRLFGTGKIDIEPQGNVDVLAGYQGQNIKNPTLPERARRNGGFDFNMNSQLNVNANIGDKLKFPISYNTLSNMDFSNQLKLDYTGGPDDIIKRFEAGNVSLSSRSTLIPGMQSLFGIKTQLQFGKLFITGIVSSQKSQRESVNLQGGTASQDFEFKVDEYEENRHFLLAQYFKNNYNKVMSNIPSVTTPVQILRMEVWVTNKNMTTRDTREIVGLMDLGESSPFHPFTVTGSVPDNNTNDEYSTILSNPNSRNGTLVNSLLTNMGLSPVQDYEKTYARKLDSTQYIYNPRVGFVSLSQPLQPDEVLAVSYQYSYNGKIYQVGEFSTDVPPDSSSSNQKILFLKLLKATSQRPSLPIWGLMMKNVYSVGFGSLERQDFTLNVLYDQPGFGAKRYVPFGDLNLGTPLLTLLNLDRLNNQNDPQPDGMYDFVEGYTVLSQYSRIIFPLLEPFGRDLSPKVFSDPARGADSLYYPLYDSIKATAVNQFPNLDRFVIQGSARTSSASDISIGFNIPVGSVTVSAGGRLLQENIDYTINYDLGTIRIINQAILNAGLPVQVNFENNATFGMQQKSYLGLRLDYLLKNTAKEQMALGATVVRLSERPFFTKVDYGEDPIRNTMYGVDFSYKRDVPRLTKVLTKLPFYYSTAPSTINTYAEAAFFKPGHAPQIGKGQNGVIYIDNFEGSKSNIDLRFPPISWMLSSTPQGATDEAGNVLFPEATMSNSLDYGKNRAAMSWYQIEPTLQDPKNINNPLRGDKDALSDPRVRAISQTEIFPQRTTDFGQSQLITFDLSFYPQDRGPYNYETSPLNINSNGKFLNPKSKWGGLMRAVDQTDFETANIEYIEMWVQDPFILNQTSQGGKLYINLGDISEDVLKDSRRFYENGLPTPNLPALVDTSIWGVVPRNPTQVTNAFSNDPRDRPYQDVGYDGLTDSAEIAYRRNDYLNVLAANFGAGSKIYLDALADPSSDNYQYYRGDNLDAAKAGILERYKRYSNPQGNSPIADNNSQFSSAATMYPDQEDANTDNTLNETEEYFQYVVTLKPPTSPEMAIGTNYIVDKKVVPVELPNQQTRNETWYQFRIPIDSYNKKIGNIPDFKSIRFVRMFLTQFEDSITVRLGKLDLVRNTWRKFQFKVDTTGNYTKTDIDDFNVGAVNIEENDNRQPLPYRTPREIERDQIVSNNGVNLLQNEQSLTLQFENLNKNDAKAVFQTFPNRDLRQFKKMQLYIHAEKKEGTFLNDQDLTAVVRIGSDFVSNYYEVRIPLKLTPLNLGLSPNSDQYNDTLWIKSNNLDLDLTALTRIKTDRNLSSVPVNKIYSELQSNGQTYSIMGNPNLGEIKGVLMGVENSKASSATGELWFNELRLSSIDDKGGWASLARLDATLADLGTVSVAVSTHSAGFGSLEQKINERFKDNFAQFDAAVNLELGKLLPREAALSIPVFASVSRISSAPEYDPFDKDLKLKEKLKFAKTAAERDSIRKNAIDFSSAKTISLTNVHRNRTGNKKPKVWDIENFDFNYAYTKTEARSPLIEYNIVKKERGGLGYNYTTQPKFIEPFKKMFSKSKTHWFDLIKDFNFNPIPNQLAFKADIFRQFGVIRARSIGEDEYPTPETYDKYFTFDRNYILKWQLSRSLNLDYSALNNARIDEPFGRLNTPQKKDTVRKNFWKGGRNIAYTQAINLGYTVPLGKLPLTDWTTLQLQYTANYRWIGASRLAVDLGNFLENGQQEEVNLQMDFNKLYSKSKWLRNIDQPKAANGSSGADSAKGAVAGVNPALRVIGKLLTSIKMANISVSQNANTRLPGYMDSTKALGQDFNSMAPGFDFILGMQPDTNWLNKAATRKLISSDSTFNDLFTQSFNQRLAISTQLEPVRDLTIDINLEKTFSKNYSETFKDTSGTGNQFAHLSPYASGSFNVTYIALNTLFGKYDPNRISETFLKFQDYRSIISRRLGEQNKYNQQAGNPTTPEGYAVGYGRYAVDVLVPAFIAAYTGEDPEKVSLVNQQNPNIKSNPFRSIIPKPNWRISYTGLSRIPGMEKIFSNFTINHAYSGSLGMNSFTSALRYQDISHFNYPSFIDSVSGNYIPYFLIPNISIQEQFAPLLGIDIGFVNQVNFRFDYNRSRQLSLSLVDFQLSEVRSTEYRFSGSVRKKGLKLPFKVPFSKKDSKTLENELRFQLDFGVRDNVTSNSRLDQNSSFATNGSKEITISPTVDYYISNRVNVKLYFDQRRVNPYISSSAPTVDTRAGVEVRISLSQ